MNKSRYTVAMKSIVGTRDKQEDCAFHNVGNQEMIGVVCDGMGGHKNGKLASEMTIKKFKDLYEKKDQNETFPSFYLKTIDILDELVYHLKNEHGQRLDAGTTFTAAAIKDDELSWLSVGDSRLYILRDDELVQVTRDHNYFLRLNQMRRDNKISEKQYKDEATNGEALISFIGMGGIEIMDINHAPFKLLSNDLVLLTTDGLYKALSDKEIRQCLRTEGINDALNTLIDQVETKAYKFQDNTTCILIRYNGEADHETHKM